MRRDEERVGVRLKERLPLGVIRYSKDDEFPVLLNYLVLAGYAQAAAELDDDLAVRAPHRRAEPDAGFGQR